MVDPRAVPDAIVTDLHFGETLSGIKAIGCLRANTKQIIPAIIMTGDASSFATEQADMVESSCLFGKPFDCEVLAKALTDLLA